MGSAEDFTARLFPKGPPKKKHREDLMILYKLMVQTSESLIARRQRLNTFFLTASGAVLTAMGIVLGSRPDLAFGSISIFGLGVAGCVLAVAWRILIKSYGQLNTGKFKVINELEKHLPAAIFDAEWLALGEGRDPSLYRSFTDREAWVPIAFTILFGLVAIISLAGAINATR